MAQQTGDTARANARVQVQKPCVAESFLVRVQSLKGLDLDRMSDWMRPTTCTTETIYFTPGPSN